MADWVAISSLATAGGTLALAATTYASVQSSNRSARSAERSLLGELRPLLIQSAPDDAEQRIRFADGVERGEFAMEILYGDYEGGQRLTSRFGVSRGEDGVWRHSVVRHWRIDHL